MDGPEIVSVRAGRHRRPQRPPFAAQRGAAGSRAICVEASTTARIAHRCVACQAFEREQASLSQVHPPAHTAPRTRAEIEAPPAPADVPAERYDITPATARKWKAREDVQDRSPARAR